MAAILKLRRNTTASPSLTDGEIFLNYSTGTIQFASGSTPVVSNLLPLDKQIAGNIKLLGDVSASNAYFTGNTTVDGNIYLGGDIFLGDGTQATDNINVNATFSGSIIPVTADVFDLGADGKYWNTIFALTGSFGNGIISGSSQLTTEFDLRYLNTHGDSVVSGSSQINLTQTTNYVSGIKTRLDVETVISGSSQVNVNNTQNFTPFSSSVDSRLDSLETAGSTNDIRLDNLELFSSSQELKDLTLETVTSSFDSRLNNVESFTSSYFVDSASVDSRLDTIEGSFSQSVDGRLDLLESFSSSLDDTFVTTTELHTATSSLSASLTITDTDFENRINTLETTFSSSVDSRLDTIEGSFSQSVDSRLDVIEGSFSQSVDLRLDNAESTGSEHESRLDNIESYTASLDNVYEEKASTTHTLFSGSSQVNADTITNFDTNVKDKLNSDGVISGSSQVTISSTTGYTTFSSSIATTDEGQNDRLDSIEAYTASVDSLYEEIASGTHTLVSGSSQIQIDSVSGFTTHSSSVDSRLDSLEGDSHTHSNKAQLDTINQDLSKTSNVTFNSITASGDVVISGDLTVLGNATEIQTSELRIEDKLITIASGSTNSAEADGAGIEIDGAGKSIIWDDATQSFILNAKVSSSVGFKGDGSELDNVTASDVEYANVLNKPTLVSGSSQISYTGITDKPTLVSGSSQIDHDLTTNFVGNEHVDHSTVSISAGNGISGGGDITTTRTLTLDTGSVHFKGGVKEKLNEESVVSGSSQILGGTGILSSSNENFTQFSSSIDSRVDTLEGTFSQSVDSRLDYIEGTFSSSVDSRLDAQEAFSESLDAEFLNTNGDNVVSGSDQVTASLDLRYEEIASGTHTLVSGSSQIDVTQTTNISTLATTGSNLFIGNQTITGSIQSSGSISFQGIPWPTIGSETHLIKTEPYTLNLESGTRTYDYAGIALEHFEASPSYYHNSILLYSYDNHDTPNFGTELNVGPLRNHMRLYPSTSFDGLDVAHMANISIEDTQNGTSNALIYADNIQIGAYNSENIAIGNLTTEISITALNTIINSPISSSNYISASFFIGDGSQLENVVASEITYENITGLPSGLVSGSSQIDVTQTTNYSSIRQYDDSDNTIHLNSLGVVSGSTYSSPSQGTLRATINGVDSDVDLGLQSTDTPTFNSLTASNLPEHGNDIFDAVFKGTSGEFGFRTLGNAAFYQVSSSISNGDPAVLGNAGAVKDYIDEQLLIIGAGDITAVIAGDGISGGADSGPATLTLDTGSTHFTEGVEKLIPAGTISGSDQVTASLDSRYVNATGDTVSGNLVISGDLTVNGTTTTINTTNLNVEDNIIELNYGGSATEGGLLVKDVTGGSTISGSLLWDGTNDYWIAGINGVESKILLANGDGVLSGSLSTQVKPILDSENVHSGSYLGTATTSNLTEGINLYYTDDKVKTKLNLENVISGSSQILGGSGILSSSNETFAEFSASVASEFGGLTTDYNDLLNVPAGIVSSSLQISNYNTFLEKNAYNVISSSFQISNYNTFLEINGFNVVSSSEQITNNSNLVSSSQQISDYNTFLEINGDNVITSSEQVQIDSVSGFTSFSSSVDDRIDSLESWSSSLDSGFVTQDELASATGSLIESIATKLDTGSYLLDSSSVDGRLDSLETDSHTHSNKTQLDTINQDLSDTSDVTFNSLFVTNDIYTSGSIIPKNPATSLGSAEYPWGDLWIGGFTLHIGETSISEANVVTTSSLQAQLPSGIVSSSTQIEEITAASGILSSSLTDFDTFSGSVAIRLDNIELFSSSQENKDLTLAGYTGSVDNKFIQVLNSTSSLNSFTQSADSRLDNIELFSSSQEGKNLTLASYTGSVEVSLSNIESFTSSIDTRIKTKLNVEAVVSSSQQISNYGVFAELGGDFLISSSDQLTGSLVDLTSDQTISGTKTFTDIVVNGTGSFAYFTATQTSLQYIGDSFIVLNNDTPTQRYAGLAVYDSGSADTTASLQFDGQTNDWFYEYSTDGGVTTDHGTVLFGPEYSTKGSPTYLTNNKIPKSVGTHHLNDSNISDSGTLITLGSNTSVTGTLSATLDIIAYASSDERLKDNIKPIENPLQKINSIGGYSFEWNVEKQHIYKGKDYGVIAQEIEKVLPELVTERENGYKAVKYDKLISLLIEGIKELSSEVQELKNKLNQ